MAKLLEALARRPRDRRRIQADEGRGRELGADPGIEPLEERRIVGSEDAAGKDHTDRPSLDPESSGEGNRHGRQLVGQPVRDGPGLTIALRRCRKHDGRQLPDPRLGERACAVVIPSGSEAITLEEITAYLAQHELARQKFPERLELVSEFPMTPSGKIQKYKLRDMIAERARPR